MVTHVMKHPPEGLCTNGTDYFLRLLLKNMFSNPIGSILFLISKNGLMASQPIFSIFISF